ncbi:tRNA (guanine-N7)-methyltransferase [uncultured Bifidobacterium sp.]|uniref:tRNA (guanine(46)-N(7))-methyltransferase TrmB n=1 Tax=uncultured Bifidobacterium sp. TaxID=165187 RepID=UPI0028DBE540|nr:tRNA (guanine-N7)-methyltransferase [uncultured Bifidobacterium sp.]
MTIHDDDPSSARRRPVLSFVRRSGRLDERLRRAWDRYSDRFLLDLSSHPGALDVRRGIRLDRAFVDRVWGVGVPLVVEIGTGQGENIAAAAGSHPDIGFLALEVYDPGVAHTLLLAGRDGLDNLRVAQVNAPELFAVADAGVVREVWTFFPDPWPKMRHHKRRLVQPALAGDVRRALGTGGMWRLATDIDDYALHVHQVMDGRAGFENLGGRTVSLPTEHVGKGTADEAEMLPHADFTESSRFAGRVLTNFERKGLEAGRTIHDFAYRAV